MGAGMPFLRILTGALIQALLFLTPLHAQRIESRGAQGDLRVAHTSYSRYDGGAAMPRPVTFLPGDQVVFRAKIAGFRLAETNFEEYRVSLAYEVSATDSRGITIGKLKTGEIKEPFNKEDQEWLPALQYTFLIPEMAEFGEARIRLHIRDEVSQQSTSFEETVRIDGKRLPDLESVSIIDFGFYRHREDRSPLPAGIYRGGDTLWAKFDVAGFKIGDQNHFHAECDVQVRDAAGKVLFEQLQAISKDARPEYPQRYLPGLFSLDIKPGTAKGEYAIAVIVHDRLANRSRESVFPFNID